LYEEGLFEQAIEEYDKALTLDPSNFAAWNGKGKSLSQLGRYKDAVECYDMATEITLHTQDELLGEAVKKLAAGVFRKVLGNFNQDDPSTISRHSRRMDFEGFLQALMYSLTNERKILHRDFVQSLYDLKSDSLMLLASKMKSERKAKDYGARADTKGFKNDHNPSRPSSIAPIVDELRGGNNLSQLRAMYFIQNFTKQLGLDDEKNLDSELLALWKTNRLSFLFFGDIVMNVDGYLCIHLARHLGEKKVSRESAINNLLFESRSESSQGRRLF